MAEITTAKIKELRETTGAGMLDCKNALNESYGDMEAAKDWLRKKGLSKAAKKAGRTAAEGLVAVTVKGDKGVAVEVNSETDFVAKNEKFQDFVKNITEAAAGVDGLDALMEATYPGSDKNVKDTLTEKIATIGENLNIRRMESVQAPFIASYIHNVKAPNMGQIAVLVGLEGSATDEIKAETGKKVAMHIAASNPLFLNIDDVDTETLNKEKEILTEQAKASGKPEQIIEKMVEGRINKYYEEIVLLEQDFIMDTDKKVKDIIKEAGDLKITQYVRLQLGDGVEKTEEE